MRVKTSVTIDASFLRAIDKADREPPGAHRLALLDRCLHSGLHASRRSVAQVEVGVEDGFKHESSIHCDALVSLPKSVLTDYFSSLAPAGVRALDQALQVAPALA